jgi:hypothetical protein
VKHTVLLTNVEHSGNVKSVYHIGVPYLQRAQHANIIVRVNKKGKSNCYSLINWQESVPTATAAATAAATTTMAITSTTMASKTTTATIT